MELLTEEACYEWIEAAQYDDLTVVTRFLERFGPKILDVTDVNGSTALHKAAANDLGAMTRLLLESGAKNTPNESGNTPLHWAVFCRAKETTESILLSTKLDLSVLSKNNQEKSVLNLAFDWGDTEVLKLVLEHKSAEQLENTEVT